MPRMDKLQLDRGKVAHARHLAEQIVSPVMDLIRSHTTVAIERAVLRLLGLDGVDGEVPLPNRVVDHLRQQGLLAQGAAVPLVHVHLSEDLPLDVIAKQIASGERTLTMPDDPSRAIAHARLMADKALQDLDQKRGERTDFRNRLAPPETPQNYVIVATGNIFEDVPQGQAAARQGADIVAVIRSTGQSLLDYVPFGATTYGTGGTYATQENFRLMRRALDEVSLELGRYVQLTNYASGLCMPEITVLAAVEGLDMLLNDAMYGILFRDINVQRTLIDQFFSRQVVARSQIVINTGEDNYLTTADAYEKGHTVLVSQFINERFALEAGMPERLMGLGHAFEIDPKREDSFLWEVAMAQLVREVFPDAPLKFMPPTKYITGDIFLAHAHNTMFNLVTAMTGQSIQLIGMLTEAIHTPFLSDRYVALKSARYVHNAARHLVDDVLFQPGGRIQARAAQVLDLAINDLEKVAEIGLLEAIEKAFFADISRHREGGKGYEGIVLKGSGYFNPFDGKW